MSGPPYRVELRAGDDPEPRLLNITMSIEAAERILQEVATTLRPGEVVHVRDSAGALVLERARAPVWR